MTDTIRSWLVCLLPRFVCRWLWREERIPLGHWAPHILGRYLGVEGQRVNEKQKETSWDA